MIGQRFGRWTVIAEAPRRKYIKWVLCRCDCGTVKEVTVGSLRGGSSRSCRCATRDRIKHGHARKSLPTHKTTEYSAWSSMVQRCTNPNAKYYENYGGRGIRICDEWLHNAAAFLAYIGPKPTRRHTLDRINNEGNYEPGNVRWATRSEQMLNTRRTPEQRREFARAISVARHARERSHHATLFS